MLVSFSLSLSVGFLRKDNIFPIFIRVPYCCRGASVEGDFCQFVRVSNEQKNWDTEARNKQKNNNAQKRSQEGLWRMGPLRQSGGAILCSRERLSLGGLTHWIVMAL